jgi:hypothetical protein
MRLLSLDDSGKISLTTNYTRNIPCYAILSHTWGADSDEVSYHDLNGGFGTNKAGYAKIEFCGKQAIKDGLRYFWVDTCCINKADNTELSESINSMFRWYLNAAKCYVYLSDVSSSNPHSDQFPQEWESAFRRSRWFTRGWTLQELIAPNSVEFFSKECKRLGDKKSLEQQIYEITSVPTEALRGSPLSHFSVEERLLWAAKRQTTRKEDEAYCLLGIFNVFIPLIYGEEGYAFVRLNEEIEKWSKSKLSTQSSTRSAFRSYLSL